MNSTVFLVALADGRVLYDSLKDRIHPVGRFWNTFTYSQFYDYFNCLQVSESVLASAFTSSAVSGIPSPILGSTTTSTVCR